MIVVADSGPLNYLILLDHAELLHRFTGEVVIPDAVDSDRVHAVTADLDLGERAGIALAGAFHADLLLIDEAAGRAEAKRLKLRVTGTLGVLRTADGNDAQPRRRTVLSNRALHSAPTRP